MDDSFKSNGEGVEQERVVIRVGSEKIGTDAVGKTVKRPLVPFCELQGRSGSYRDDDNGLEIPSTWVAHVNHPGRG